MVILYQATAQAALLCLNTYVEMKGIKSNIAKRRNLLGNSTNVFDEKNIHQMVPNEKKSTNGS